MKIQLCCPDMNEATNVYLIKEIDGHTYIPFDNEWWDVDYCPFCGREITLIQSSTQTAITEVET